MLAIFTANALSLGFIAAIWDRSGALNIMIKMFFVAMAVANAAFMARYF